MQIGRKRTWYQKLGHEEKILVAFAMAGSVLALLASTVAHLYDEGIGYMWVNYLFTALLIGVIPLQLCVRHFQVSTCFLMVIAFTWLTISLLNRPTIQNKYLFWYSIMPICGALLLRYRGLMLGGALSILGISGFLLNSFFVLTPEELRSGQDFIVPLSSYLIFILLVASLTLFFIKANDAIISSKTQKLDTLLQIVSHDIANPLTLIRGLSDLLTKNDRLDDKGRHQVAKIFMASDTIYRILERVRHIQAIKSGKLVLRRQACSIQEAILAVIALNENHLQAKEIELVTPQVGGDIRVMADPVTLTHEVLNNLLTNAIKFSNTKGRIYLRLRRQGDLGVFEIEDEGIGIPEGLLRNLFDEFKVTTRLGTDGERGTGFGVSLVKNLVEAYGGYLEIESRSIEAYPNGHGTAIRVFLPLAPN